MTAHDERQGSITKARPPRPPHLHPPRRKRSKRRRPVSGLIAPHSAFPQHQMQWQWECFNTIYRCGGSAGLDLWLSPNPSHRLPVSPGSPPGTCEAAGYT